MTAYDLIDKLNKLSEEDKEREVCIFFEHGHIWKKINDINITTLNIDDYDEDDIISLEY